MPWPGCSEPAEVPQTRGFTSNVPVRGRKGTARATVGTTWTPSTGSCHQGALTGLSLSLPDLGASLRLFTRPHREHTKPKWCLFTSSSQVL